MIATLPSTDVDAAILAYDNRFRLATGTVDLLRMSNSLPPEEFRAYILLSREQRRRRWCWRG